MPSLTFSFPVVSISKSQLKERCVPCFTSSGLPYLFACLVFTRSFSLPLTWYFSVSDFPCSLPQFQAAAVPAGLLPRSPALLPHRSDVAVGVDDHRDAPSLDLYPSENKRQRSGVACLPSCCLLGSLLDLCCRKASMPCSVQKRKSVY